MELFSRNEIHFLTMMMICNAEVVVHMSMFIPYSPTKPNLDGALGNAM